MPACTCSAPGIRCRTCSSMPTVRRSTRCTDAVTAFDISLTSSFRNAIYPAYKASREPAPPELKRQFDCCRELAAALGFAVLADAAYESVDLIGSVQAAMREHAFRSVIVSADKDFGQLLG